MSSAPDGSVVPAAHWESYASATEGGFDTAALAALDAHLRTLPTTSLMIVQGGRIAHRYGDIGEVSYLASTRKSVLSMLYGPHVAAGRIDLDLTLADLGIDDVQGLQPIERTARIRDILTSRSGVYYPAGSPGGDEADLPPRGSKRPGRHFHYNNWDFNVAGAIFRQLTGLAVHDALQVQLARPLGFEDFDRSRQRMLGYPDKSRFLAYHMFLSARDMARLGLLALRRGNWGGVRLIAESWMIESTRPLVPARETHGATHLGHSGYGYYWWTLDRPDDPAWHGAFLAWGHFGQYILCLPALDMLVVHRRAISDEKALARNSGSDKTEVPSVSINAFIAIADRILAARKRARGNG